jgi:hypothetical protein
MLSRSRWPWMDGDDGWSPSVIGGVTSASAGLDAGGVREPSPVPAGGPAALH